MKVLFNIFTYDNFENFKEDFKTEVGEIAKSIPILIGIAIIGFSLYTMYENGTLEETAKNAFKNGMNRATNEMR